jgi:hypothetical protein
MKTLKWLCQYRPAGSRLLPPFEYAQGEAGSVIKKRAVRYGFATGP